LARRVSKGEIKEDNELRGEKIGFLAMKKKSS